MKIQAEELFIPSYGLNCITAIPYHQRCFYIFYPESGYVSARLQQKNKIKTSIVAKIIHVIYLHDIL